MRGGNNRNSLKFAVVAIFKNEAMGIREWVEHYKWQGADKVLLLNNNSTDNWKEQLQGFEGFVTVTDAQKNGAQVEHYEKLGIPWLKENNIDVVTFLDIDEFMFGTGGKNLKQRVEEIFGNPGRPSRVSYLWTIFGSSGHYAQPKSVRKGFVWKAKNSEAFLKNRNTIDGSVKSIAWVKDILPGPIHMHSVKTSGKELSVYDSPPGIQLNHYRVQSKQFWRNIKMSRGNVFHPNIDNKNAKSAKRNWTKFDNSNVNEVKNDTLENMVEEYERNNNEQGGGSLHGNVYVFYHIYCNNNTSAVVKDQVAKIIFSGLYERVTEVKCVLTGEEGHMGPIRSFLNDSGVKFKIQAEGVGDTSYERFTLNQIQSAVKDGDKFLYIHSKGVSAKYTGTDNIYWWRTWMEFHLIHRFKECLDALDRVDLVGVGYTTKMIGPHFSGNFWWTTAKYFSTLPKKADGSLNIGDNYTDPENYIFKGKEPRHIDLDDGRDPNVDYFSTKPGIRVANVKKIVKGGSRYTRRRVNKKKQGGSIEKTIDIVIARYNENLSWLDRYKNRGFREIWIYNKNKESISCPVLENKNTKCAVKNIDNVGMCDHTYLYHIVHNYDTLADVTIFMPGSANINYKNDLLEFTVNKAFETRNTVMNVLTFDIGVGEAMYNFGMEKYTPSFTVKGTAEQSDEILLVPAHIRPFGKWYEHHFPGEQIKSSSFFGLMAISREHIHRRPKSFYENLLSQVDKHKNAEAPHYIERSWTAMIQPISAENMFTHKTFDDLITKGLDGFKWARRNYNK